MCTLTLRSSLSAIPWELLSNHIKGIIEQFLIKEINRGVNSIEQVYVNYSASAFDISNVGDPVSMYFFSP